MTLANASHRTKSAERINGGPLAGLKVLELGTLIADAVARQEADHARPEDRARAGAVPAAG
jgi:hypothetical protein